MTLHPTFISLICLLIPTFSTFSSDTLPPEAQRIVDHYQMEKIPHEGVWFKQTAKSDERINGPLMTRYEGVRHAYTSIVTLMTNQAFSALHRLKSDEIWHFYQGAPSELLLLYPDGSGEVKLLGNQLEAGHEPQILVPRGTWMGAWPIGSKDAYTFFGNTVSPGFEYADYEPGDAEQLTRNYPQFASQIQALTRQRDTTELTTMTEKAQLTIEELVGLNAPMQSSQTSVAKVTMPAGTEFPLSYNLKNTEVIIGLHGEGEVIIEGKSHVIEAEKVILLKPTMQYRIVASSELSFYAIVAPAFTPDDHIVVKPE